MCPDCRSLSLEWQESSGRGVVYTYALLHHPQHPAFTYPVSAVLVDLEEGPRILSNLVDVDPSDIRIGMAVEVAFEAAADGYAVPVFRPTGGAR